jgi:hypothetical protein
VRSFLTGRASLGHTDKDDALLCAFIAFLFATEREVLERPGASVSPREGWIWVPAKSEFKP